MVKKSVPERASLPIKLLWYFICWLFDKGDAIMINQKEFRVIKNKVMSMKTAMLKNISREKEGLFPVVANAVDVEEDGHLWMLVNSRMKKWEQRVNIPVKLDFIPGDCHIVLSGIGHIAKPEDMPEHLRDEAQRAKSVVKMKIFYGEYTSLGSRDNATEKLPPAGDLLTRISDNITGRTYRRILFFR
jgi:hypothetical protein